MWRSLDQAQGSKCWRCVPVLSECTSGDLVVCGLCRHFPLLLRPMFLLWALVCVCHILLYLLFDGFLKVINCLCWLWFVCSVGGVKWCWWCVLLARCEVDLSSCDSLRCCGVVNVLGNGNGPDLVGQAKRCWYCGRR